MNNYLYNIPDYWYNFNNGINNNIKDFTNKQNDLESPMTGFEKGNLFKNLYDPYKNFKYGTLSPSNKREEELINILKYNFALTDLDLYLDINPYDNNYIELYKKYLNEKKRLLREYEKKYGPLTLESENNYNDWQWINSPWPWEVIK